MTGYDFKYPELSDADISFSNLDTNPILLAKAKEGGFDLDSNPYNKLFNQLFFKGGSLNYKKGINPAEKNTKFRYLKAMMFSFNPSHEEKEAVCALILSELVDASHE